MVNVVNTTVGNLINNSDVLPDASIATSTSIVRVAAAGTTQATATAISAELVLITNNTAANGVILPVGVKGQKIVIAPLLVTNAPKVYPPVGGTIFAGTINANVTVAAQTKVEFYCIDDTGLNWI